MKTAEFCAAEGISTASFYAWRRKLEVFPTGAAKHQPRTAKHQRSRQPGQNAFQQVLVYSAPALAVRLPGGVEIEASGADEQSLRAVALVSHRSVVADRQQRRGATDEDQRAKLRGLSAVVRIQQSRLEWGFQHCSRQQLGSEKYFKEESHVRRQQIKNPSAPPHQTVKLAKLWEHLPAATRQSALKIATRILKSHVTPQADEVKHEDS